MACINVKVRRATDPPLVEVVRLDGLNCVSIRPICKIPTEKPQRPPKGYLYLRTSEKKIIRTKDKNPILIKAMATNDSQYYDLPWTGEQVKEMLSGLIVDENKEQDSKEE